ncbi:MAG TPA: hypothetical protein VFH61_02125 [Thermoleophilia bacterium]|nr:hypothetical protein [Thermoleophilia bacterium]
MTPYPIPARCPCCGSVIPYEGTGVFCCAPWAARTSTAVTIQVGTSSPLDRAIAELAALTDEAMRAGHGIGHRMSPRRRSKCRRHRRLNCNVPGC